MPGPAGAPCRVLAGKVAVVTGAASGIGRATVDELLALGTRVVLLGRVTPEDVAEMGRDYPDALDFVPLELRDSDRIPGALDEAAAIFGGVDILINAAGTIGPSNTNNFLDITPERWHEMFQVNTFAPFLLMQATARHMIAQQRGGRIVNISSSSASRAIAVPDYAASKAALDSLTRTMAAALGPHDINVNAVAPGLTRTPMSDKFFPTAADYEQAARTGQVANLLGRASEPEDVSGVIVFLCRPESRQITGQVLHTSAGLVT